MAFNKTFSSLFGNVESKVTTYVEQTLESRLAGEMPKMIKIRPGVPCDLKYRSKLFSIIQARRQEWLPKYQPHNKSYSYLLRNKIAYDKEIRGELTFRQSLKKIMFDRYKGRDSYDDRFISVINKYVNDNFKVIKYNIKNKIKLGEMDNYLNRVINNAIFNYNIKIEIKNIKNLNFLKHSNRFHILGSIVSRQEEDMFSSSSSSDSESCDEAREETIHERFKKQKTDDFNKYVNPSGIYNPTTGPLPGRDPTLLNRLRSLIRLFREMPSRTSSYVYNRFRSFIWPSINEGVVDEIELDDMRLRRLDHFFRNDNVVERTVYADPSVCPEWAWGQSVTFLERVDRAQAEMEQPAEGAHGSGDCNVEQHANTAIIEEKTPSTAQPVSIGNDVWERMCSSQQYATQTDLMSRFKLLDTFVWDGATQQDAPAYNYDIKAKTSKVPVEIALPLQFIEKHQDSPNCVLFKQFAYFRGDMEIQIKVNASPFYMGQLQASFYYAADFDEHYANRQNISTASQMTHTILDASINNPAILTIPYRYYKPLMGTCLRVDDDDVCNMGRLRIFVLNKLTPPANATQNVIVSVYVRFINPRFHGMKPRSLGVIRAENEMMRTVIKGAVDGGVEALLNQIYPDSNRDNPPNVLPARAMVPWPAHSWSFGDKISEPTNCLRLQAVGQTPYPPGTLSQEDEMSLRYVTTKFGYVNTYVWNVSDQQDKKIFVVPFSPILRDTDYKKYNVANFEKRDCFSLTPVGFISSLFSYWRGSLEFRVDVVATSFHRGTLAIGFVPRVALNDNFSLDMLTDCDHSIFNLSDCRQFSYICKYVADKPWWPRKKIISDSQNVFVPGYIYCIVVNPLRANDTVSQNVELNLYMRAHTDFEVQILCNPSYALSFNTNKPTDMLDLVSYAPGYGPPDDEIYSSDWSGVFPDRFILRYGTLSGKITPFNPSVIQQYFIIYKLYNMPESTIWLYDSAGNKFNAPYLILAPSNGVDTSQAYNNNWGTAHGIPITQGTLKTAAFKALKQFYNDVWKAGSGNDVNLNKISFETGYESAALQDQHHRLLSNIAYKYYSKATDVYNKTQKYYWETVSYIIPVDKLTGECLPESQNDERDCMFGDQVSVHGNVYSTWDGLLTFGEQVYDLKQILRRYTPYSHSTHTIEHGSFENNTRVDQIIPLLPQGLRLFPTKDNYYSSYIRDGTIASVLSGYRFYRGGLRFRFIISARQAVKLWIQHIPDGVLYSQSIFDMPYDKDKLPHSAAFIMNSGYALWIQDSAINPVVEIEIPFYSSVQMNLLQRPDMLRKQDGVIFSLGNLNIGFSASLQPENRAIKTEVTLNSMYCIADDFSATVFQGFPLVFNPVDVKLKDHDFECVKAIAEGPISYFRKKVRNVCIEEVKSEVANQLAGTSISDVDCPEDMLSYLLSFLPVNKAKEVWDVLKNFIQIYLCDNVKAIAISVIDIFVQLGFISFKCMTKISTALYNLITKLKVFSSKQSKEGEKAEPNGLFDDDEEDRLHAAFTSTVVSGVLALMGADLTSMPTTIPAFSRMVYSKADKFTRTSNGLFTFFKNNLKMFKAIWSWVVSKIYPEYSLAIELQNSTQEVEEFGRRVMFCLDARNDNLIRNDPIAIYQVYECANIAQIINCKLLASEHETTKFPLLRESCNKIIALRDKLTRELVAPQVRFEPFVLCLEGETKVGKSYMTNQLVNELLASVDYKSYSQPIYVRSAGNAYWNGVNSQPFVVYDDYLCINDSTFGMAQAMELFCLKSCATFNPPMAAVEEKNLRYNPMGVVLLMNKPFTVPTGIAEEKAFLRRRDVLVKVSMKKEYEGKDPRTLPKEVTKDFGHLYFQFYTDVTDQASVEATKYDYKLFKEDITKRFKQYYENELVNYNVRLREIKKFYPDIALSIDMNCDILTKQLEDYERKLVKGDYNTLETARKTLKSYSYLKDFPELFKRKMQNAILGNNAQIEVNKATGEVTGAIKKHVPYDVNMRTSQIHPVGEVINVNGNVQVVGSTIVHAQPEGPNDLSSIKETTLGIKSWAANVINDNCFMCRCFQIIDNIDGFKLMTEPHRVLLRQQYDWLKKTTHKDLQQYMTIPDALENDYVIFEDSLTGNRWFFTPCEDPTCDLRLKRYEEASNAERRKCFEHVKKILNILPPFAHKGKLPAHLVALRDVVAPDLYMAGDKADAFSQEISGEETKSWMAKLWEKIPSFWTVIKFMSGSVLFLSLLRMAISAITNLAASFGVEIKAPSLDMFSEMRAMNCVSGSMTGLVGSSIIEKTKKFLEEKPNEKKESEMPSSGTSATASKRGLGRAKIREMKDYVVAQSLSEDHKSALLAKILRNTFWMRIVTPSGRTTEVRCLGICNREAIVLDHYIFDYIIKLKNEPESIIQIVSYGNVIDVKFKELKFRRIVDSAIMIMTLPKRYIQFKNILNLFMNAQMSGNISRKGVLVETAIPKILGDKPDVTMWSLDFNIRENLVIANDDGSDTFVSRTFTYPKSGRGLCGSVLISDSNVDRPILGIHVAGMSGTQHGFAEMLIYEEYLNIDVGIADQESLVKFVYNDEPVIDLPPGVMFEGVVAKDKAQRCSPKSRLAHTECAGEITPITYDFPLLSNRDPRIADEPFSPLYEGVKYHGLVVGTFPEEILRTVVSAYKNHLLAIVKPMRVECGKLSIEHSVCGILDNDLYDGLDTHSSEGYPWNLMRPGGCSDKSWLFDRTLTDKGFTLNSIHPKLDAALRRNEEIRRKGVPVDTIFADVLKDSKMPKEKACVKGKTRIFSASPIDYSIVCRQYFYDFTVALQAARFQNFIGIGIDVNSFEATILVNYLLEVGNNIIVGDYTKFGDTLMPDCIDAFFDIMIEWNRMYYNEEPSEEEVLEMRMLCEEVKFSKHICLNVVYSMFGGMPSGNPLTTPINSGVNVMYIMCVYMIIMLKHPQYYGCDLFFKFVRIVTYGDDVIMSVADEIKEIFNFLTIQDCLASFGIVFTPASKTDEKVKYHHIFDPEVTFLKCNFRKHPTKQSRYLMALDKRSVEETCNWYWTTSKDSRGSAIEACDAMLRNAYGHGPTYYNDLRESVLAYWISKGVSVTDIPSWEELDLRNCNK